MNPKILDTIGRLDESIIHEAEETAAEKYFAHKKRNHYMRLISVAASFVICFCLCLPILLSGLAHGGDPNWEDGSKGLGGIYRDEYGTIKFEEYTDHSVTLIFDKTTEKSFYVVFYGYESKEVDGQMIETNFYACTDPNYESYGEKKENVLQLTVNGEQAESLPTSVGKYTVIIDFSALIQESISLSSEFCINDQWGFDWSFIEE